MMQHTAMALRGIVTAPHHLAAQSGLAVLREGGNAVEAAIAACATCAVAYPHMNGMGGDGFWLIQEPGKSPICIDASGAAGSDAKLAAYRARGLKEVPAAGPLAAATVAGMVSGWQAALEFSQRWEGRLPLSRLFEEAIHHAGHGIAVTQGIAQALADRQAALIKQPGFADLYGHWNKPGKVMRQPGLARLLESLARTGLDDFYRGAVAQHLAEELRRLGCPISSTDLARHRSVRRRPLAVAAGGATIHTTPPPTQGLATLIILGLFERVKRKAGAGFGVEAVHALVEAAKLAYEVRDRHVTDPAHMAVHATTYLADPVLDRMARDISAKGIRAWGGPAAEGDTVWLGVIDGQGRAVSVIQSLRQAWGSGVVVGDFGLIWHNRAIGFSLDEARPNPLMPGRKPFHTLAPALARFKDGRTMPFGTMGGDGQPQTLAALFTRYALYGQTLQQAVSEPRWRLDPGPHSTGGKLFLENRFGADIEVGLARLGHSVEMVAAFDSRMGHAGALVRHENGLLEGAFDPRSDGAVAAF
jgi:gamma-glutamyltranspeptidase